METPVFGTLVLAAFGLMIAVSGGIIYLTLAEWRDRRRRDRDSRGEQLDRRSPKGRKQKVK